MESGALDAFTIYGAQVANVRYSQGRLHVLLSIMEESLRAAPEPTGYCVAIALAHARGGSRTTAQRLLDAELADDFATDDENWLYTLAT